MNETEIIALFKDRKYRATPQRVAVYKYLCENPTHADADEIYKSVTEINHSFSKTTVYNALQSLERNGFIMKICIDSDRVRYDANVNLHGHFICKSCRKIFDFDVEKIECNISDDFHIMSSNVYYSGVCPECK